MLDAPDDHAADLTVDEFTWLNGGWHGGPGTTTVNERLLIAPAGAATALRDCTLEVRGSGQLVGAPRARSKDP